ncbi:MAG: hypothetical protein HFG18_12345 [Oscillospiraceae bacterium]|nr:hypothetical protein [Oscillospiraceae bacterium]
MTKVILLEALKKFTLEATKDIVMPVEPQEEDEGQPAPRPAQIFGMNLPDGASYQREAPYILHQIINSKDVHPPGQIQPIGTAIIRSVFCVYHEDGQEGGLLLLNLMERMRIALMKQVVIGGQFTLDLREGLDALFYTEKTAPFFGGEMISQWRMKSIGRELNQWQGTEQIPFQNR